MLDISNKLSTHSSNITGPKQVHDFPWLSPLHHLPPKILFHSKISVILHFVLHSTSIHQHTIQALPSKCTWNLTTFPFSKTTLVQVTILPHLGPALNASTPTPSPTAHFSIQQLQGSFQCFAYLFTPLQRFLISEEKTKVFKRLKRPCTSGSLYLLALNTTLLSCKTLQSQGLFCSSVNTPNPFITSGAL